MIQKFDTYSKIAGALWSEERQESGSETAFLLYSFKAGNDRAGFDLKSEKNKFIYHIWVKKYFSQKTITMYTLYTGKVTIFA